MIHLGRVRPGSTIYCYFDSFDGGTGASITLSGLATTDIEIYKDGSNTTRASDSGYALLGTDGIDEFGTGIHGFSVNLADNGAANFYEAGSHYVIVIASVTVDAQTVNFVYGDFWIGYEAAILDTTIATLGSQTSFTLEEGSADNNAYVGCRVVVHDLASAVQVAQGYVSAYTGATKTVTLAADPAIFTMAAGDSISFFPRIDQWGMLGTILATPTTAGVQEVDITHIAGAAVSTAAAQLGVNVVNAGGTAWASGSLTAGVFAANAITAGAIAADAIGASELAADAVAEIADAVWDEDATAHQTQGTFGQAIGDPVADTNTIYKATVTDATGATVGVDVAAILDDTGTSGVIVASLAANSITAAVIATGAIDADAIAADAIGASELAADAVAEIADAIWDEDATAHQTGGTFGQAIGDPGADANTIYAAVVTNAAGATIAADIISIQADTDNIQTRIPAALVGGRMDSDVAVIQNNAITAAAIANGAIDAATFAAGAIDAAAIATGAIDADALATDAVTEIRSVVSGTADSGTTTTMVDAARTEADTDYWKDMAILFTSGTITGQARLITAFTPGTDTITFSPATTQAVGTNTYEIIPNVAAAGATAPTAAEVADAVWDEDATGHQTGGTFGQAIGDPGADATTIYQSVVTDAAGTNIAADIIAIEAQTDDIGIAGAGLTAIPWNATWDAEVQSEVQDALDGTIADSIPADGTRPSISQALYMLTQFMLERAVVATTVTVNKPDGTTALFTLTLNDATNPTTITRAT